MKRILCFMILFIPGIVLSQVLPKTESTLFDVRIPLFWYYYNDTVLDIAVQIHYNPTDCQNINCEEINGLPDTLWLTQVVDMQLINEQSKLIGDTLSFILYSECVIKPFFDIDVGGSAYTTLHGIYHKQINEYENFNPFESYYLTTHYYLSNNDTVYYHFSRSVRTPDIDDIVYYDSVEVIIYDTIEVEVEVNDTVEIEVYDTIKIEVFDTIWTEIFDTNIVELFDTVFVFETGCSLSFFNDMHELAFSIIRVDNTLHSNLIFEKFELFDLTGKLRLISNNSDELYIGFLDTGIYILHIELPDGGIYQQKIFLE